MCLCQQVKNVLDNAARRFIRAGRTPAANSMVWCSLLHILADSKWKMQSSSSFDRVIPGNEMYSRYLQVTRRVLNLMPKLGYGQSEVENNTNSLLWAGAMLYKQALRFTPLALVKIEGAMEEILPGVLEDDTRPFFWDIHIARHALCGAPDRSRLSYLYSRRMSCFEPELLDPSALAAYKRAAAKEMEYLLDRRLKPECATRD